MQGYDIIGDIHGCAGMLVSLLQTLGYRRDSGIFSHPGRTAVFVGDFIDRGEHNLDTLRIVKGMVDHGTALAVIGNHEYNALCYHTRDRSGNFLRPHNSKNRSQHNMVLTEISKAGDSEWRLYLDWFLTLPLFIERDGLRVVHACWDPGEIKSLKRLLGDSARMTNHFLQASAREGTREFTLVETVLKGKELDLPGGLWYRDRDGQIRKRIRVKWWLTPEEISRGRTFADITQAPQPVLRELSEFQLPGDADMRMQGYSANAHPVFFGHYWFSGIPRLESPVIACLDYSAVRGGYLCCYRFNGEFRLCDRNLVFVNNLKNSIKS